MPSFSSSSSSLYHQSIEDLINIEGLLTEDAVVKILQARFYSGQYYVSTIENAIPETLIKKYLIFYRYDLS